MRDIVTVIPNFITQQECDILNQWTDQAVDSKWLDHGVTKDHVAYQNRLTTRMYGYRFDKYHNMAYAVQDRIRTTLDIWNLPISIAGGGKHGIVVSNTLPGGDVYLHCDPKENNLEVLRCNIITRAAESGAELTVADKVYDIKCGDLHCYLASKYPHKVSTVGGCRSRILWMFGFQINNNNWEK